MGNSILREPLELAGYGHKPWDLRKRIIPSTTYSGKVVRNRPKHYFRIRDVQRISDKVLPPEDMTEIPRWLAIIRAITIGMLEKILFFIDSKTVESFYDFCIEILDKFFRVDLAGEKKTAFARRIIVHAADLAGIKVTFPKS